LSDSTFANPTRITGWSSTSITLMAKGVVTGSALGG
jgi:hypothetical protein